MQYTPEEHEPVDTPDGALTVDEYRARWGLSADHPMVAPNYATRRRDLAKQIGLGRKPGTKVARRAPDSAPAKRGRPAKA